jgi:hypothetical protein
MNKKNKTTFFILASVAVASAYSLKSGIFSTPKSPAVAQVLSNNEEMMRAPAAVDVVATEKEIIPTEAEVEAPSTDSIRVMEEKPAAVVIEDVAEKPTPAPKTEKAEVVFPNESPKIEIKEALHIDVVVEKEKISEPASKPEKIVEAEVTPVQLDSEVLTQSNLSFKLNSRYLKLAGHDKPTNTTGSLYSPALLGVDLKWKQIWTKDFSSFIATDLVKSKVNHAKNKTFLGVKQTLVNFNIGFEEKLSEKFSIIASVGHGDELVYRALDSQSFQIEKIAAPKATVSAKIEVVKKGKLALAFEAGYLAVLPFKNDYYSSKTGHGYKTAATVTHTEKNFAVTAELFYSTYKIPLPTVDFTRSDIGVGAGLSWSFDQ